MLLTSRSVADCFSTTPRAPKPHGPHYVAVVFGGGQHDDARGHLVEIHFFEDRQAVFIRHAQIQQQNVRLQFRQHLDALGAVLRFADNGNFVVAIEEFAEAVAEDRVVIRHQYADLLFSFGHSYPSGTSIVRRAP